MSKMTAMEQANRRRFLDRARTGGLELVDALLTRYANLEGIDRAEVAARLQCSAEGLDRIATCALPRAGSFDADVQAIASLGGADPAALSGILQASRVADEALLAAEPHAQYETGPPEGNL